MYKGSNPSALRSRQWLCNSLLKLLETKSFNEITIKDICKEADLSRQTFYKIFDSKEEIIKYHFKVLFNEFENDCHNFENMTLNNLTFQFFTFFKKHADFIQILTQNKMSYVLENEFEHYLPEISIFNSINEEEKYPDYTISFIAGALCQILMHWYEKDMDLSVEEIAAVTSITITGNKIGLLK